MERAECITNAYAIEEARRNLELKTPKGVLRLEALVARCELVGGIGLEIGEVGLKAKDMPILGGAIVGQATHLLTGDERDFGALFGTVVRGVRIASPRMLAEEMVKLGWLVKE